MNEFSWQPSDWLHRPGLVVGFVVEGTEPIGDIQDELEAEDYYRAVSDSVKAETEADDAFAAFVDPFVGAGGYGLGVLLQFLAVGADFITWTFAVNIAAPRILRVVRYFRSQFGNNKFEPVISLSSEALQVLAAADVCKVEHLDPNQIAAVRSLWHTYPPPEPRTELRQIYSAHTVAIEAHVEPGFHKVWSYLLTPQGHVIGSSAVPIPIPNATRWMDVELPHRKLSGLS